MFPKRVRDNIIFTLLFIVAYLPGLLVIGFFYVPYKLISYTLIILHPGNWSSGGGNPFKGRRIATMDSTMLNGEMGREKRGIRGTGE